LGKSRVGRYKKHCHISLATDFSGRHDGFDFVFTELFRRRLARRARPADEKILDYFEFQFDN